MCDLKEYGDVCVFQISFLSLFSPCTAQIQMDPTTLSPNQRTALLWIHSYL
jgi:hypothetical protein